MARATHKLPYSSSDAAAIVDKLDGLTDADLRQVYREVLMVASIRGHCYEKSARERAAEALRRRVINKRTV